MNILFITEYFPEDPGDITGGVEARAFFVAKELAKKHSVTVLTSCRKKPKKYTIENIRVVQIGPAYPYTQKGHLFKRMLFGLNSVFFSRKIKADVVEGCSFFTYLSSILHPAESFITYHEVWLGEWVKNTNKLGFIGEIAERAVLLGAKLFRTNIIAVSNFTKDKLVDAGVSEKQVRVIHNGVDLSKYNVRVKKFDKKTVCYVGRLTKHKRVQDLIKAVDGLDVECKIVGKGQEKEYLESIAGSNVEFLGFLPSYMDVIKTLKKSHVFCSPSVVEGFGITLLEAMACNVPFVCSDIAPFREVSDGRGGLFFKPKDHKELRQNIKRLLEHEKFYKTCVEEEKLRVSEFDWNIIAKKVEEYYKD